MSPAWSVHGSRAGRLVAGALLAISLTAAQSVGVAPTAPSTAKDPAVPMGNQIPAAGSHGAIVPLITGDKVLVLPSAHGAPAISAVPRAGRSAGFMMSVFQQGNSEFAVPRTAIPQFGHLLDRELFNIPALVAQGYDEAHSSALPLLVQYRGNHPIAASTLAAAGLHPTGELPSIHATAATLPYAAAWRLGAAMAHPDSGPLAGVRRILLDHRSSWRVPASSPAQSPTRLSPLPRPRSAGATTSATGSQRSAGARLTGAGVTVAVLDAGIDETHPDLAGQVVGQANFTGSPDDTFRGPGSHAASLIAGTGAASGGAHKGIAPGARLLDVQVANLDGQGLVTTSDESLIQGMQWAVQQHARIVDIGAWVEPDLFTDDSAIASQALDKLAAANPDTLFVVAAGDQGPSQESLRAPGSAAAALTVGATGTAGQLASFSGRGPQLYDGAIKPDLVAPGLNVLGAYVHDHMFVKPVSRYYGTLSGTRDAAAEVSGAAALLAQQHPGWDAARLEAVLEDSAAPLHRASVYEQGGGQLDLASALAQQVVSDHNSLDFGGFDGGPFQASKLVKLTNSGESAITLRLRVRLSTAAGHELTPAQAGVTPTRLTLAPGASGTVRVSVNLPGAPAQYTGALTVASGSAPQASFHVPIGASAATPSHNLTLRGINREGQPAVASTSAVQLENVDNFNRFVFTTSFVEADGSVTLPVPVGHYAIQAQICEAGLVTCSLVFAEATVDSDTSVTLDARTAQGLQAAIAGQPTQPAQLGVSYTRTDAQAHPYGFGLGVAVTSPLVGHLFVTPTSTVSTGSALAVVRWRLIVPGAADPSESPMLSDLLFHGQRFTASLLRRQLERRHGRIESDAGRRSQSRPDGVSQAKLPHPNPPRPDGVPGAGTHRRAAAQGLRSGRHASRLRP
jgi:subtilisin family serine protease